MKNLPIAFCLFIIGTGLVKPALAQQKFSWEEEGCDVEVVAMLTHEEGELAAINYSYSTNVTYNRCEIRHFNGVSFSSIIEINEAIIVQCISADDVLYVVTEEPEGPHLRSYSVAFDLISDTPMLTGEYLNAYGVIHVLDGFLFVYRDGLNLGFSYYTNEGELVETFEIAEPISPYPSDRVMLKKLSNGNVRVAVWCDRVVEVNPFNLSAAVYFDGIGDGCGGEADFFSLPAEDSYGVVSGFDEMIFIWHDEAANVLYWTPLTLPSLQEDEDIYTGHGIADETGIFATGLRRRFSSPTESDIVLFKMDSSGNQTDVVVLESTEYFEGEMQIHLTEEDIWLYGWKYTYGGSDLIGAIFKNARDSIFTTVPSKQERLEIQFEHTQTGLQISTNNGQWLTARLMDTTGKVLAHTDGKLIQFNPRNYTSGFYLVEVIAGEQRTIRKLVFP